MSLCMHKQNRQKKYIFCLSHLIVHISERYIVKHLRDGNII